MQPAAPPLSWHRHRNADEATSNPYTRPQHRLPSFENRERWEAGFFLGQATGKAKAAQPPWESLGTVDGRVGRTLLSDAFDLDLDSRGGRAECV